MIPRLVAAAIAATSSHAATITWAAPVDINNDVTQISTNGTVHATAAGRNLGGANTTGASVVINGVTFFDNQTIDAPTHQDQISGATGVTGVYNTLLNDGDRVNVGASVPITFTGLTINNIYEIQFWASDTRNTNVDGVVLNDGTGTAPNPSTSGHATVRYDVVPNTSAGQFVIGTFVADAATQQILVRRWDNLATTPVASGQTLVQAWQIRDLGAVPEPSAVLLGGIGALALLRRRRD
jgi:hypothetical protein